MLVSRRKYLENFTAYKTADLAKNHVDFVYWCAFFGSAYGIGGMVYLQLAKEDLRQPLVRHFEW